MEPRPSHPGLLRFGVFEVDLKSGELRKAGMRQKLSGQPFQVLRALVERAGQIITREELRNLLWPGNTFVDFDLALKKAVNRVREVLGDSADSPRFIETIPRCGYRFIAPVEEIANGGGGSPAARTAVKEERTSAAPGKGTARRTALVAGTVLAFSVLIALGFKIAGPKPGSKPPGEVSSGKTGYVPSFARTNYDVGSEPDSVVVGDFNSDGKLDVAVANAGDGTVSVLLGNGDGSFQSPMQYTVGRSPTDPRHISQLAVGDLNGDGVLDLVVSNYGSNNVSVLLGNGNGTFRAAGSFNAGTNPTSVAMADLNGDGKLDLVVSNQNCYNGQGPCGPGTVSVLLGNGDGTFQAHKDFSTCTAANWVAVGDFNSDGKLDMAVACGGSREILSKLSILLGNGDGTFQTPFSYPLKENGDFVGVADFNRDGKLDLAVGDNIGLVCVFLGNGDGTFRARVDYPAGPLPSGSIGMGDFNGDGNLDLAVASLGSNSVTILLGNGDGTFRPWGFRFETGMVPQGVAVGDFRRNGKLGLAVPARSSNVVSILLQ